MLYVYEIHTALSTKRGNPSLRFRSSLGSGEAVLAHDESAQMDFQ